MTRTTENPSPLHADVAEGLGVVGELLLKQVEPIVEELLARILDQEPAYQVGRTIAVDDLRETIHSNVTAVFGAIAGRPLDASYFDANGRRRASSSIPLHAILHAYRIGGLLQWEAFARTAATVPHGDRIIAEGSSTVWHIIESASQHVTHGYRDEVAERQRRSASERTALLELIMAGKFAAASDLWEAADALSLTVAGRFVVVAAPAPKPGAEGIPDVQRHLAAMHVRSAWLSDASTHVGVVSLGTAAPLTRVVDTLSTAARGPVGLSEMFDHLSAAPAGLRQARVAMTIGQQTSSGVIRFDDVPLQAMLVRAPDHAENLRVAVLKRLVTEDDAAELLDTLAAWTTADGSVSECARLLYLHRNSVHRRLRRIHELTGFDPQSPRGMAMLYVALEAHRLSAESS